MRCPPWPRWHAQSDVWRGRPSVVGLWGAEEHACRRPGPRAETYESRLGYRAESGPVPRRTGQPPRPCSPRGGVPGHAPHWSTGTVHRAEVNVATCCLEAGSVRGKQDTGRRTPAGERPPVAAVREVSPLGSPERPPAVRAAGLGESLAAACGVTCRRDLPAPGCGGAPAPSPRSALQPAQGRGIRDLPGGSESRGLRARLAGLDRVSAPPRVATISQAR